MILSCFGHLQSSSASIFKTLNMRRYIFVAAAVALVSHSEASCVGDTCLNQNAEVAPSLLQSAVRSKEKEEEDHTDTKPAELLKQGQSQQLSAEAQAAAQFAAMGKLYDKFVIDSKDEATKAKAEEEAYNKKHEGRTIRMTKEDREFDGMTYQQRLDAEQAKQTEKVEVIEQTSVHDAAIKIAKAADETSKLLNKEVNNIKQQAELAGLSTSIEDAKANIEDAKDKFRDNIDNMKGVANDMVDRLAESEIALRQGVSAAQETFKETSNTTATKLKKTVEESKDVILPAVEHAQKLVDQKLGDASAQFQQGLDKMQTQAEDGAIKTLSKLNKVVGEQEKIRIQQLNAAKKKATRFENFVQKKADAVKYKLGNAMDKADEMEANFEDRVQKAWEHGKEDALNNNVVGAGIQNIQKLRNEIGNAQADKKLFSSEQEGDQEEQPEAKEETQQMEAGEAPVPQATGKDQGWGTWLFGSKTEQKELGLIRIPEEDSTPQVQLAREAEGERKQKLDKHRVSVAASVFEKLANKISNKVAEGGAQAQAYAEAAVQQGTKAAAQQLQQASDAAVTASKAELQMAEDALSDLPMKVIDYVGSSISGQPPVEGVEYQVESDAAASKQDKGVKAALFRAAEANVKVLKSKSTAKINEVVSASQTQFSNAGTVLLNYSQSELEALKSATQAELLAATEYVKDASEAELEVAKEMLSQMPARAAEMLLDAAGKKNEEVNEAQ